MRELGAKHDRSAMQRVETVTRGAAVGHRQTAEGQLHALPLCVQTVRRQASCQAHGSITEG